MGTCFKQCYATRREAKQARRKLNQKYGDNGLTSIYWCEACSNYHLTSMPKFTRPAMRKNKNKKKR